MHRATDLLQVANFTSLMQLVNKSVKIKLVATCHLQTCKLRSLYVCIVITNQSIILSKHYVNKTK